MVIANVIELFMILEVRQVYGSSRLYPEGMGLNSGG